FRADVPWLVGASYPNHPLGHGGHDGHFMDGIHWIDFYRFRSPEENPQMKEAEMHGIDPCDHDFRMGGPLDDQHLATLRVCRRCGHVERWSTERRRWEPSVITSPLERHI